MPPLLYICTTAGALTRRHCQDDISGGVFRPDAPPPVHTHHARDTAETTLPTATAAANAKMRPPCSMRLPFNQSRWFQVGVTTRSPSDRHQIATRSPSDQTDDKCSMADMSQHVTSAKYSLEALDGKLGSHSGLDNRSGKQ
jgi:hypothetical protein